jgi:hypothetical protein
VVALNECPAVCKEFEDAVFVRAYCQMGGVAPDEETAHDADGREVLGHEADRKN